MDWLKIFTLLSIVLPTISLNILGIFPHPGVTHFYFFHPIMRALADAGHDVTVVSQFPDARAPKNYKDMVVTGESLHDTVPLEIFEYPFFLAHFFEFPLLKEWGEKSCHTFLNSSAIKQILKSKKTYDVILLEQFNNDCMMAVAWKLNAPVIGLSSCPLMPYHSDRFGTPDTPSYIPVLFLKNSEQMTFIQRMGNFLTLHAFKLLYRYLTYPDTDKVIKQYLGDGIPPAEELVKQTSLMFLNQHYSLSGPYPRSPSVVELMGVHIKEPKEMDESLQHFLDSSTNGVILVSWGSMVKSDTMPEHRRQDMLNVFKSLKQNVLWKWTNDTIPNKPDNVMIRKWVPQRDILCHPNVLIFMTHGGSMGAAETVYCGVPTIITPFYGDQYYNGAAFEHRRAGVILQYKDINEETLSAAIKQILNPEIMENAKKLSYSFRNRQRPPNETAVWWVEHVAATHGSPLLKSHSVYLSSFVYHSFDIYLTLLIGFVACVYSWIWVIQRFCRSRKIQTKEKTQ